jgi:hypothetical protein
MKITRYNRGYQIKASDHEMAVLRAAWKHIDWDAFKADLSSPQHRSMSRRMCRGLMLRTDADRRSGEFRGEVYAGPHNNE